MLVFGHTHKPWIHTYGGVLFVNCGSVGKPKDGDPRAAFAILELDDAGEITAVDRARPLRRRGGRARGRGGRPARRVRREAGRRRMSEGGSQMKYVLFVCTHNAGRSQMAQAFFERDCTTRLPRPSPPAPSPRAQVWPEVVEVMREVGIDLSGNKPKRLTVEMQLHADWAVTMGCGDVCPYVPTRVDDWDIPDPAGKPHRRGARDPRPHRRSASANSWRAGSRRSSPTAPRTNGGSRSCCPQLIEEFGDTRDAGGDPRLRGPHPRRLRPRPDPHPHFHARAQTHPRVPRARDLRSPGTRPWLTDDPNLGRCLFAELLGSPLLAAPAG